MDNTLLDLHNSSYHTQPHPVLLNIVYMEEESIGFMPGHFIDLVHV